MTRLEIVADQGRRLRTGTNAAQPEEADTAPGSRGWAAEKPRSVARLRGRARSAYAWLLWAPSRTAAALRRLGARGRRRMRALGNDEAGAVTAEYAIVIESQKQHGWR
ncbi:hypothetical protein [Leucobacter luti]|uniref:hypothetical protein n=1 Tax=Leucobacter luti TaxID=340320 RepID=UPI003CFC58A5